MQALDCERVKFSGSDGELLVADLYTPAGDPRASALFAHCFACRSESGAALRIVERLTEIGFAVLAVDFTGVGDKGRSMGSADLLAAADFLRQEVVSPQLLVGHSLAGSAILSASEKLAHVLAIATIAAPSEPRQVRALLEASGSDLEARGEGNINLDGCVFPLQMQVIDELENEGPRIRIRALSSALLVLHSPVDTVIAADHSRRSFIAAPLPKGFASIDGADHMLVDEQDAEFAASLIASWAHRHITRKESLNIENWLN